MELRSADFAGFFHAVHGCKPFPWQQALVDLLAESDEWPDVLDLPTGTGKTATLDAAVFHLALRASVPKKAALRIALVVDRRLVVDDAFSRAKKIECILANPSNAEEAGREIVSEIANRLQLLAGQNAPPLVARRLRGGAPLEHDWARTPTQPTILCSTVDQVGSRLLFRGYGVSNRMKPVHAGLLGQDSLILLDEAHLSEPFRQTLSAVRKIGEASVKYVLLSATSGVKAARPFALTQKDRAHPILKQRLEVTKPARLRCVTESGFAEAFATDAIAMMQRLQKAGVSSPAVGVVVNRVDLARDIFQKLKGDSELDGLLMIGRSRDIDRDQIVEKLAPFRTAAPGRSETAAPLFVVATQCLEVGVDLDLDGLVTQVASLDALRQRFGRLNRAGRQVPTEGVILTTDEYLAKNADDPIYGDRIRKTWKTLESISEEYEVDFGILSLDSKLQEIDADIMELAAPKAEAPVLMPAYLDLWSQTSPIPIADPEIGLFLHGAERSPVEVSIVWRSDIFPSDMKGNKGVDLKALMELVSPRVAEMIEIPLWSAKAWLLHGGHADEVRLAQLARIADVPEREESDISEDRKQKPRAAFLWAGSDDPRTGLVYPDDIRSGDVLVVPAEYGGCDEYGWAPSNYSPVMDVADDAARPFRGRRHTVRIARDTACNNAQWDRLSAILTADDGSIGSGLIERLLNELPTKTEFRSNDEETNVPPIRFVRESLEMLQRAKGRITPHSLYVGDSEGGVVLVAAQGLQDEDAVEMAAPATEDDSLSQTSAGPVTLDKHSRDVAEQARRFAETLGLPSEIVKDLSFAARLHDTGKADRRFQIMLSGGDLWNRSDGPAMAKSGQSSSHSAWKQAGLPKGWRHEALSVRMALIHPSFQETHDPALVLWLIGSHHGFGRPFFNFIDTDPCNELLPCLDVEVWQLPLESGPQTLAFDFEGLDWPGLFEELKKRYGIWGLAQLEAILRLADHRVSEAERIS